MELMEVRRRVMSAMASGGAPIESGQFTVSEKTKTYDIMHNLGVVPNFAFIYPIDVKDPSTTYLIISEILVADAGQANWAAGTDTNQRLSVHAMWRGVGYATGVHNGPTFDGLPLSATIAGETTTYAGLFTNEFVRVGGPNQQGASGFLLGAYGYIVGAMPFITAE